MKGKGIALGGEQEKCSEGGKEREEAKHAQEGITAKEGSIEEMTILKLVKV